MTPDDKLAIVKAAITVVLLAVLAYAIRKSLKRR
jgi:hypothetical protein